MQHAYSNMKVSPLLSISDKCTFLIRFLQKLFFLEYRISRGCWIFAWANESVKGVVCVVFSFSPNPPARAGLGSQNVGRSHGIIPLVSFCLRTETAETDYSAQIHVGFIRWKNTESFHFVFVSFVVHWMSFGYRGDRSSEGNFLFSVFFNIFLPVVWWIKWIK